LQKWQPAVTGCVASPISVERIDSDISQEFTLFTAVFNGGGSISVHPLLLSVSLSLDFAERIHHGGTENTEYAQSTPRLKTNSSGV
jgi:hypothetical protein